MTDCILAITSGVGGPPAAGVLQLISDGVAESRASAKLSYNTIQRTHLQLGLVVIEVSFPIHFSFSYNGLSFRDPRRYLSLGKYFLYHQPCASILSVI
jgi:hypothetical protein